jgi:hypothetical protein
MATGSVADTVPATAGAVAAALEAALRRRVDLVEAPLPAAVLERAEALAAAARRPG